MTYDLIVVGGGSAGMTAAEFASRIDLKTVVVERSRIGGDCLWTGCVPSKALLAAAKAAHTMRTAARFGLPTVPFEVDTKRVFAYVRAVRQRIADADDNAERYRDEFGVDVVSGSARLMNGTTVHVAGPEGEAELCARYVLVCTGSRPAVPPVPGLAAAGYLTSENLFEQEAAPRRLVIIGSGPVGVEMAQAFARLGTDVTVLDRRPRILSREEPELAAILARVLEADGVRFIGGASISAVEHTDAGKTVHATVGSDVIELACDEILVAAGRRPNVDGLGLEEIGIEVGSQGVAADDSGRTAVATVYVAGDLAGRRLFTHAAGYEAVTAIRSMFYPGTGKVTRLVPWTTFTDPELAHAGMTEEEARARFGAGAVRSWVLPLERSDRARAEDASEGQIRVVTGPKGRIVGAHVLAPAAGEMIHELVLAIGERMTLPQVGRHMHVYPTLSVGFAQLGAQATYAKLQTRLYRLLRR